MEYILTEEQARFIDNYTINKIGIPEVVLMERAALSVADAICHREDGKKILVVCGTGNNGADGICVGRILYERGYDVTLALAGNIDKATKSYMLHRQIAVKSDMTIVNNVVLSEYDIVVDALFGIGLSRNVEGKYKEIIECINKIKRSFGARVYSVDIPSGIHATTGSVMGCAVKADVTVTFGMKKMGVMLYPGHDYAGQIITADIGFSKKAIEEVKDMAYTYTKEDLPDILPERIDDSNKGTYKRVLIIAGSRNMAGACILAAKAAIRSGSGLVKVLTDEANRIIIQSTVPEALLCTYSEHASDDELCNIIMKELMWAQVVVLGPGIGTSDMAKKLVNYTFENVKSPFIVDADAINIISEYEHMIYPDNTIITPHLKEMSRLIKAGVTDIKKDIVGVAKKVAAKNNIIVVLKDSKTVVSDGKKVYINSSGNNGMSKGGSGDVLSGIIAGFVAGSKDVSDGVTAAVFTHGYAADTALKDSNFYALTPTDIIDNLKNILD